MELSENVLKAIGNTPLVKLNKLVGPGDATVLVKCEFMNPGASIKDRMALHIVDKAEKAGLLKPGGTIVENTSGNTGFGLAMVATVRGYRCIFTMPDKMSQEKINALKAMGAEVVVTPTNVPADDPRSYYETAKRIARETPGSFFVNQYHNADNIEAHYLTTGPEIWRQTEGRIDCFVAGLGTGGTMSGAGKFFKEKKPAILRVPAGLESAPPAGPAGPRQGVASSTGKRWLSEGGFYLSLARDGPRDQGQLRGRRRRGHRLRRNAGAQVLGEALPVPDIPESDARRAA